MTRCSASGFETGMAGDFSNQAPPMTAADTPSPALDRRQHSLGGRLVLATLGFCLLFTLIVAAVRTWSAWEHNVAVMSGELKLIAQVYERTLSKSIWDMDRESMEAHLASVSNVPSVGQVVVTLQSSNRAAEVFKRSRPGWLPSTQAPVLPSARCSRFQNGARVFR